MIPSLRVPRLFGLFALVLACLAPAAALGESASAKRKNNASAQSKQPAKHQRQHRQVPLAAAGSEFVTLSQWPEITAFIDEMVARENFDKAALLATFSQTRRLDTAIQLIKPAPSHKPKNWQAYRARFVEPKRIAAGLAFWDAQAQALTCAETQYGVPAEIIVAILGVETIYGRNTGNFRVMDTLTTLAFDYPQVANRDARMAFFRGELESALLIAREMHIDPLSLLGSYAGAIGWPQFMPSSIRQYAVDSDGSGQIDLRNSPVDAIGSIAHFLKIHGWQRGEPTVFPTAVGNADTATQLVQHGLEAKLSPAELAAAGVAPGVALPVDMRFGLVDLQNGVAPTEYWLATNNFFAIARYNRSYFYAMSIVDLSRALLAGRTRDLGSDRPSVMPAC